MPESVFFAKIFFVTHTQKEKLMQEQIFAEIERIYMTTYAESGYQQPYFGMYGLINRRQINDYLNQNRNRLETAFLDRYGFPKSIMSVRSHQRLYSPEHLVEKIEKSKALLKKNPNIEFSQSKTPAVKKALKQEEFVCKPRPIEKRSQSVIDFSTLKSCRGLINNDKEFCQEPATIPKKTGASYCHACYNRYHRTPKDLTDC